MPAQIGRIYIASERCPDFTSGGRRGSKAEERLPRTTSHMSLPGLFTTLVVFAGSSYLGNQEWQQDFCRPKRQASQYFCTARFHHLEVGMCLLYAIMPYTKSFPIVMWMGFLELTPH